MYMLLRPAQFRHRDWKCSLTTTDERQAVDEVVDALGNLSQAADGEGVAKGLVLDTNQIVQEPELIAK